MTLTKRPPRNPGRSTRTSTRLARPFGDCNSRSVCVPNAHQLNCFGVSEQLPERQCKASSHCLQRRQTGLSVTTFQTTYRCEMETSAFRQLLLGQARLNARHADDMPNGLTQKHDEAVIPIQAF